MKLHKSKKDPELYYYFNSNNKKRWCYRHRYYDALGKRKEKSKQGFTSEKEAYRALLEVKTSTLNGDVKQVESSNMTVSEWLDIWYESHKNDWKERTRKQRESVINDYMKPLLGDYKIKQLDKNTYKRVYINELLKSHKPSTVALYHRLFKVAVNDAVENEILTRNRFNRITIEQNEVLKNFLTANELNVFLSAAKKYENITSYTLILTLAYTGLRKGEAMGLKWSDIDIENKTLTVERTKDRFGVRTPKTKRSYRTILVDDSMINQLKVYRKWCMETKLSFGKKLADDDFIFISPDNGEPVGENTLHYSFKRIYKHIDINRITPHGLRHTNATILISQRIPVRIIADRLGNTPQMIHDIYGHSFKAMEEESVSAFSRSLNQAGGEIGGGF